MVQDYIYEYNSTGSSEFLTEAERELRTHQPEKEIITLSDYRCGKLYFQFPWLPGNPSSAPQFESMSLMSDGCLNLQCARCARFRLAACSSHVVCRRTRHNQYNSDVDTQAMRASAPLIPVWDDHGAAFSLDLNLLLPRVLSSSFIIL